MNFSDLICKNCKRNNNDIFICEVITHMGQVQSVVNICYSSASSTSGSLYFKIHFILNQVNMSDSVDISGSQRHQIPWVWLELQVVMSCTI